LSADAAIHEVLKAGTYITSQFSSELSELVHRKASSDDPTSDKLTPQQREVLNLVIDGRSAKEIAGALDISTRTAEYHKARFMKALGVRNISELIKYAVRAGISSPD
jgi:DNA-binding NarL/FixJ family response regulator